MLKKQSGNVVAGWRQSLDTSEAESGVLFGVPAKAVRDTRLIVMLYYFSGGRVEK